MQHWSPNIDLDGLAESVSRKPKASIGTFLSGNWVLADDSKREEFRTQIPSRKLLAIEMEAAGIKASAS